MCTSMRILHYMFGLPPVYGGGLVRYALDLIKKEMDMGQEVSLLIPGALFTGRKKKTSIHRTSRYQNIPVYKIRNPLPIPMGNGILDIDEYTRPCDAKVYEKFFGQIKPDIIHIHTFMGLHAEFLDEAAQGNIPVIFTTHDYFGICPIANMLFSGHICMDQEWKHCGQCCKNAYTKKKLWLEHTIWYRCYRKHTWLVKLVHSIKFQKKKDNAHKETIEQMKKQKKESAACSIQKDYTKLKNYYQTMFQRITCFHFNSSIAKAVYESRLGNIDGKVVSIRHAGICDNRRKRSYGKLLRIGYFGTWTKQKGFFQLLDVCIQLFQENNRNIQLHIYSDLCTRKESFIKVHPYFGNEDLEKTLEEIDVLIVPSIWPETFGFTALEALSYGVPVILSQYVGAKDLMQEHPGIGFLYDGTSQGLKEILKKIYVRREMLRTANENILKMQDIFSFENHTKEVLKMYLMMQKRLGDRNEISKGVMGISGDDIQSRKKRFEKPL